MKCKKIVSTLLASAIITTSVFTGDLVTANAATVGESMPAPVATYTFDGTLSSKEGTTAVSYTHLDVYKRQAQYRSHDVCRIHWQN